ncbi:MAG: hypothetical protein JNM27_09675 [Leptospirales bacterium]|nr:hypothetical protein [Leptospirales bacterium]
MTAQKKKLIALLAVGLCVLVSAGYLGLAIRLGIAREMPLALNFSALGICMVGGLALTVLASYYFMDRGKSNFKTDMAKAAAAVDQTPLKRDPGEPVESANQGNRTPILEVNSESTRQILSLRKAAKVAAYYLISNNKFKKHRLTHPEGSLNPMDEILLDPEIANWEGPCGHPGSLLNCAIMNSAAAAFERARFGVILNLNESRRPDVRAHHFTNCYVQEMEPPSEEASPEQFERAKDFMRNIEADIYEALIPYENEISGIARLLETDGRVDVEIATSAFQQAESNARDRAWSDLEQEIKRHLVRGAHYDEKNQIVTFTRSHFLRPSAALCGLSLAVLAHSQASTSGWTLSPGVVLTGSVSVFLLVLAFFLRVQYDVVVANARWISRPTSYVLQTILGKSEGHFEVIETNRAISIFGFYYYLRFFDGLREHRLTSFFNSEKRVRLLGKAIAKHSGLYFSNNKYIDDDYDGTSRRSSARWILMLPWMWAVIFATTTILSWERISAFLLRALASNV